MRAPLIAATKEVPRDMVEAISSCLYAAQRVPDLPELDTLLKMVRSAGVLVDHEERVVGTVMEAAKGPAATAQGRWCVSACPRQPLPFSHSPRSSSAPSMERST